MHVLAALPPITIGVGVIAIDAYKHGLPDVAAWCGAFVAVAAGLLVWVLTRRSEKS
jgi:hypothetical protein